MRFSSVRLTAALAALLACACVAGQVMAAEAPPAGEPSAAAPANEKQYPEVTEAGELLKKLDFDGAYAKLKEAAQKYPELPPAPVMMASIFARVQGAANAVRTYLDRAVTEYPDDPQAYMILGDAAIAEGRLTEADLLFTKASSLMGAFNNAQRKKSLEPGVSAGLARVAAAREQWAAAQKQLETWLKLDPKNVNAMRLLATILFRQKKPEEARTQLKTAYEIDAKSVPHWGAAMAILYEQAEDHPQAKKWVEYALKAAPKDLTTQLTATNWALQTGEIDLAKQYSGNALKIDGNSLEAKILNGVVALFQKDYAGAAKHFEAAHIQSPANFAASNNLALALCEMDEAEKKNQALQYAENNARTYGQSAYAAEAASTLGWVLYKGGNVQKADEVLARLRGAGRVSEDTAYYMARVAAERGRKDEAKNILDNVLKSKRPFSMKKEAQELYDQLNKK